MINLGYTINKSTAIDIDTADLSAYRHLLKKEPSVANCISCGTCAATCSAGQFIDFNLRKLMLLSKRGQISELKDVVPRCMLCGKCQFACPKGVNTRHIVLTLSHYLNERTI